MSQPTWVTLGYITQNMGTRSLASFRALCCLLIPRQRGKCVGRSGSVRTLIFALERVVLWVKGEKGVEAGGKQA